MNVDSDDGGTVFALYAASLNIHDILCADNSVISDTAWVSSNGGLGGGPGVTIVVTKGYVVFSGNGGYARPRWVQFESSGVTLTDGTITTDRTGFRATTTGGVTIAASPVVKGLADTSSMKVGMVFAASSIPAGRTIKSVDSASQITLNDGTSVTAATALPVTLSYPVVLYEKEAAGALIGPLFFAAGTTAGLIVYEADGVTVNPYIDTVGLSGTPWLRYTSTPLPGATPYAFKVAQSDGSGGYHVTSFSVPVVAAPNKLTDAVARPVLAQLLTSTYLKDKFVRDNTVRAANYFHGYRGQSFAAVATVSSPSGLYDQMSTFSALAVASPGGWYHILLDTGTWDSFVYTYNDYDFKPGSGGGLLITNKVGAQPVLTGGLYTGSCCGVQVGLLGNFPGIATTEILLAADGNKGAGASWRLDSHDIAARTQIIFRNVAMGHLADPSNSNPLTSTANGVNGVYSAYIAEQITVEDCRMVGGALPCQIGQCRMVVIRRNDFSYSYDDYIHLAAMTIPYGYWGTSGVASDGDASMWLIEGNLFGQDLQAVQNTNWSGTTYLGAHSDCMQVNNNSSYYNATGGVSTAGSAVITGLSSTTGMAAGQVVDAVSVPVDTRIASVDSSSQITLNSGTGVAAATGLVVNTHTYAGAIHLVCAYNVRWNKVTGVNVCPTDNTVVDVAARNFYIPSGTAPINAAFYCNVIGDLIARGLDFGNGKSTAEFNVFAGSAQLPANSTYSISNDARIMAVRNDPLKGTADCSYSRNNIASNVVNLGLKLFSEGDVLISFENNSPDPNTVLTGPFGTDSNGRTNYTVNTALTGSAARKQMFNLFRPLGAAGARDMLMTIRQGASDILSKVDAATVAVQTDGAPIATGVVVAQGRWYDTSGGTGAIIGTNVTANVA
jgi:hypothetical protein